MKILDMHCDTIGEIYHRRCQGETAELAKNNLHVDLERMKQADYLLQNFAMFVHLQRADDPFQTCMKMIDCFYGEMEKNADCIQMVRSYEDIKRNLDAGKMSALLTIEEGGVCKGDLALLRDFYYLGVRMMTLTWNFSNELGHPNTVDPKTGKAIPNTIEGLTDTGIAFVQEMQRLGMIVDVSHLGDAGIYDVIRYTKKPFVASHSNARAVCSHPRNLTDDMIRSISTRGGVIGMNFYASFLTETPENGVCFGTIDHVLAHIRHIKNVGGIDCIGLGSDFDGISDNTELLGVEKMPLLAQAMERNGFTTEEIEKVYYKNVLRVYQELL